MGNVNAREHMGLVYLVANKWHRYRSVTLPLEDLVQLGALGLVKAIKKFDLSRGNCFSTYAMWWIKAEIRRGIHDTSRLIRLPVKVQQDLQRARHAFPPAPLSLDAAADDERSLYATIPSESEPVDAQLSRHEEQQLVKKEVATLSPRTQTILRMRFDEGHTLASIGEQLGLSRTRVQQIESDALKLLKKRLERAL